jgi:hypothetical protein
MRAPGSCGRPRRWARSAMPSRPRCVSAPRPPPVGRGSGWRDADPVVADLQEALLAGFVDQGDEQRAGVGVPRHVGEQFLQDAEQRRGHRPVRRAARGSVRACVCARRARFETRASSRMAAGRPSASSALGRSSTAMRCTDADGWSASRFSVCVSRACSASARRPGSSGGAPSSGCPSSGRSATGPGRRAPRARCGCAPPRAGCSAAH